MDMILKAKIYSVEITRVRSPTKALMDDMALMSTDKQVMQSAHLRIDGLINWLRKIFNEKNSRILIFANGVLKYVIFKIAEKSLPAIKNEPVK